MLGARPSEDWAGGASVSSVPARAGAFAGRLGDGRVLVATAAFRFVTVFFFGALPRTARPLGCARLAAFREPAERAFFRRLVRSAIGADPSEAIQRIKDCVERLGGSGAAGGFLDAGADHAEGR